MATEYYEVLNPTNDDKTNSVHGSDSPYVKQGTDEVWLLTYTNDYVPANGFREYRVEKQTLYDGQNREPTNKRADAFLLEELIERCKAEVIDYHWDTYVDVPVKTAKMHVILDLPFRMLERGHISAARAYIEAQPATTEWPVSYKNDIVAKIDLILDDYDWLKDSEVYT